MDRRKTRILSITITLIVISLLISTTAFAAKSAKPALDKQVNGADSTSAGAGETVTFTLTSSVPDNLWKCFDFSSSGDIATAPTDTNYGKQMEGTYYNLVFHDKMDPALDLDAKSIKATIGGDRPVPDNYITVSEDVDCKYGCTFHVTLDLVGLYNNKVLHDQDYATPTAILITYDATLDAQAAAGTYENKARVSCDSKIVDRTDPEKPPADPDPQPGPEDPSEPDEVYVYTYKIQLKKTDRSNGEVLAGAEFKLEMWNAEAGEWKQISDEQATDAQGLVAWDGLKGGRYQLIETEAPDGGYIKDDDPVEVILPKDAGADDQTAEVSFTNGKTPGTGGSGTAIYTAVGLTILCCAAGVLVASKKKIDQ